MLDFGCNVWHNTAVPIFVERFILPLFVAVVVLLAITNPMGFDKTQRIVGSAVLILAAYWLAHTVHKQAKPPDFVATPYNRTPPASLSPPADTEANTEDKLFSVAVYSDVLVGSGQLVSPYFWVFIEPDSVSPIDAALEIEITNLQNIPVEVSEFSVQLAANGGWMALTYVPFEGREVYIGSVDPFPLTRAAQVTVFPEDIAAALKEGLLSPGKPVKGVGFFKYSTQMTSVPGPIPRFRISVHDSAGHNSIHDVSCPANGFIPNATDVQLNAFGVRVTGKYRDLTVLKRN